MSKIFHRDIIQAIESACPLSLQETWDNSGWQVGAPDEECRGVLLAVEATEATVQEAIGLGCNLLVTHHPLLFHPLKHLGTSSYQERTILLAIQHKVAIYSAHTNADNAALGINHYLAERFQLQGTQPLAPLSHHHLYKLSVMVPRGAVNQVRDALCEAGAGRLGNYDHCSFSQEGIGRFRPLVGANPSIGTIGCHQEVEEVQLSLLVESCLIPQIKQALHTSHPYEVPAYEFIDLSYPKSNLGTGIVGDLPTPISEREFLETLAQWQNVEHVAYSRPLGKPISRIALCGGSGGNFLFHAIKQHADAYLTGEAKYNDYLDAADRLLLVTIGHHESESVARRLFLDIISAKIPNFVLRESLYDSNPVNYL